MPLSASDIHFTRWLYRAYLLVLFIAPLPLGSNRPWFWTIMVAAISVITLVWSLGWLNRTTHLPRAVKRNKWPLLVLLLFCAWSALQLLPAGILPGFLIPAYLDNAYASAQSGSRLSADMYATGDSVLLSLGLFLFALATILLVRSKRRALLVLYTLVLAGFFQALYGSLMTLSGVEYGFLDPKQFGRGNATGTFINRNHYANFLVLSLSAGMGLLLAQMNLRGADNMRQRLRSLLEALLGPKARLRIFMIIMVIALVLTRSRMGNTAFFAALTLVGLFALWRLKSPSRPLMLLVVSILIIDVFVVGTWFGVEKVIDRISDSVKVEQNVWKIQDKVRLDADRESLDIISKSPVSGMGGGSFYTVYPAWRGYDQAFMDHTHNDYLEFAVEYGLVGVALLAWFLALCIKRCTKGLEDRDRPGQFGIAFGSLMAITGMMVHATVDFSLQIPANAIWFVVLCMLPFSVRRRA